MMDWELLAGMAYMTSTLVKVLAAKSRPEARELRKILKVTCEAIAQAHNLAHALHPVKPEGNGLMVALKSLARRTKSLFRVKCRFTCRAPVLIVDNVIATHLYRIAQEAITNAVKHGKAGLIQIRLTATPGHIHLAIIDDGAGMLALPQVHPGMGLRIMRYRAGMMNGSLAVHNEAAGGTSIACTVPLLGEGVAEHRPKASGRKD